MIWIFVFSKNYFLEHNMNYENRGQHFINKTTITTEAIDIDAIMNTTTITKNKSNLNNLKTLPKLFKKNKSSLNWFEFWKDRNRGNWYWCYNEHNMNYENRGQHFINKTTITTEAIDIDAIMNTTTITKNKSNLNNLKTLPKLFKKNKSSLNWFEFCLFKKLLFTMENATAADSSQSNISRILHLKRQKQRQLILML